MDDLIKRQDAQMAVQDHYNKDHGFRSYEDGQRMLNKINALPSAQKTGKWKKYEGRFDYDWECSECECSSYEKTDYCAHCGARMECEEE